MKFSANEWNEKCCVCMCEAACEGHDEFILKDGNVKSLHLTCDT